VSLLHARRVFTDAMLTFTENTMCTVCAHLNTELVEFNGESDYVHLLVAYLPRLAISVLAQRLKGHTPHAVRREYTGACVRAHMRGHL
jgi:putative transposase